MSEMNPAQNVVPPAEPLSPPPQPPPAPVGEPPAPRPLFLRKPAIVLFVVGLLIVIAGFANFVPGGARSGGAVCFWGVLLFAFSFIRLPKTGPDAPPPMSALQRIAGVFYEPANVFRNLRSHPRWLAGLLLIASLNIAYSVAFTQRLTPERIVNYMADKMAQTSWIPAEAVERQREEGLEQAKNPVQRVGTAIASVVGTFAFMSLMGALYMLGVLVFGGRINFWQSLCAMIYAAVPIVVIQKLISLPLLFIKDVDDIHPIMGQESLVQDNLGVLFSPAERPVLFVLASAIGLLSFYGLWLKATGLKHGGQKVSKGAAWGTAILFWTLGLIFLTIITALFPSFIS